MDINNSNLLRQNKDAYGTEFEKHIFEQYKLYVEMADRISARRMLANSFFLGTHTALITALSALIKEKILQPSLLGLMPFIVALLLCFIWWRLVISYQQLNSGKFKIVHQLEQMLPTAPYDAEWLILGEGKDKKIYSPLTHVENFVPICFGLFYFLLATILLFQNVEIENIATSIQNLFNYFRSCNS
jgi:hypothetical protein